MENPGSSPVNGSQPQASALTDQRNLVIGASVVGIFFLAGLVGAVYFLLLDAARTELIRDVMIIMMAFELLLIGITAVLLIIQIARLVNLLKNEIKPLIEAANETIYTLRGTATFISDSLLQPVVKLNSYMAAFRKMLDLLNININK